MSGVGKAGDSPCSPSVPMGPTPAAARGTPPIGPAVPHGLPPARLQARSELARRELARRSYGEYLAYVGGRGWRHTAFSEFLAARIQEFVEAPAAGAYHILLIESPPQHGKSMTVTEALPSWYLGRHPERRVIIASYNDETAERFARRNREKLRDFGGALFGVALGEVKRRNEFEVEAAAPRVLSGGRPGSPPIPMGPTPAAARGTPPIGLDVPPGLSPTTRGGKGSLISRGILAGITGRPADLLIIDDPVKNRQEADSETQRRKVWDEWLNSLKTRLSAGARVVVIMTPWHEDDLAGRLQESEPGLTLLRLPVEAEEGDPLGRAVGAPLCPELGKGEDWLRQFKESYVNDPEGGLRAWTALYQCAPRAEEGSLVKRAWWKYYDPGEIAGFASELISVDAAFKGGEDNDFVSIQVWGKRGSDYFLRACVNRHMDFPETLAAIRAVKKLYPNALAVLIEDKANGPAVISVLQKEMFCIPVDPKGGKVSRVQAVSAAIESGHVYLPEGESWVEGFVDQFTAFPAGKHDDMVDAASQALSYMLWSRGVVEPSAQAEPEEWRDPYDVYGG